MRHLNSIKAFVLMARGGSISGAARRLNISAATASSYLDTLESHLGGKLFTRSTRQLVLTDLGHLYLERVQPVIDQIEAADQLATEFGAMPKGSLKVTSSAPLGRLKIARMVARFAQAHPELDVRFDIDDGFRSMLNEQYHVAIWSGFDEPSHLIQRKIASNRHVLVASPGYLKRAPPIRSPDDLQAHDVMLLTEREDKIGTFAFRVDGIAREVHVEAKLASNNNDTLTIWALEGCGIAQKSLWEVADAIAAGRLVRLLPDVEPEPADIFAVSPFRSGESVKVDRFIDFMRAEFKKRPLC